MNKLLAFIICILCSQVAFGQQDAIDKYFSKYKNDEEFSVVYISPKMFRMISKLGDDDMDIETKEALEGISSLKILTRDDRGRSFYEEAKNLINMNEYEVLMTVRGDSSNVDFLVKDSADENIVNELLLLVGGEEDFALLSFFGKIHLNKISKLAESIDIDGTEHLDKLNDKN